MYNRIIIVSITIFFFEIYLSCPQKFKYFNTGYPSGVVGTPRPYHGTLNTIYVYRASRVFTLGLDIRDNHITSQRHYHHCHQSGPLHVELPDLITRLNHNLNNIYSKLLEILSI